MALVEVHEIEDDGGRLRLVSVGARRYSIEPEGRRAASQLILVAALHLFIRHAGTKRAAEVCLAILGGEAGK